MDSIQEFVEDQKKRLIQQLESIRVKDKPFDLSESIDDMITAIWSWETLQDVREVYQEFWYTKSMYMAIWLFGTNKQKNLFDSYRKSLKK